MKTDAKKQLTHIGTIELISLSDDGIYDIPAKVDTGADSSAIWASNVHLESGKLVFNFFAPGSVFYRPEPVSSTAFKVTAVTNSFGHKEFRYKIRLNVKIGEHTLTRWFSLADRSNNTYPILLGKNFLKNRFIVDVAQKFIVSEDDIANEVLVLGSKENADFFKKVSKHSQTKASYKNSSYDSFLYVLDGADTKIVNVEDGHKDVSSYALTYFKSHVKNAEFAAALAEYLHFKSRPFIDKEVSNYSSASKLTEYMKLNCYDLPVPFSICAKTSVLKERYEEIADSLGTAFVLKEIASDRGANNYFIQSKKDFLSVFKKADKGHIFLAQKYVENDGFLRVYVLGNEAKLAIWRGAHPHTDRLKVHLNKPSGSANAKRVNEKEISGEVRDLAIKATQCMDRQVAGVDLIQDKHTKKWYILEVNSAPQLRSGSFVDEKVKVAAQFFDKELRS